MKNKLLIYLILFTLIFISCEEKTHSARNKNEIPADTLNLKYAKWFQIVRKDNVSEILIKDPWSEKKYLEKYTIAKNHNYTDFALLSVSDIGYFNLLNQIDYISGIADTRLVYNKKIIKGLDNKSISDIGLSADVNKEILLHKLPEIFIKPAFKNNNSADNLFRQSGINVVYNIDWMEKHPLGRAEWIKFIAEFTGQSEKADSIFNQIENNYNSLKEKAKTFRNNPKVIIGANYKGVWYMPGGKSYKAKILADAAADYYWKNTDKEGSLALNFENVLSDQINADFWIDIPFKSKSMLISNDEKYGLFKAFKTGEVYHNLKKSNEKGANYYWEYALARPDLLLRDLIVILHPEKLQNDSLIFYQKLSE